MLDYEPPTETDGPLGAAAIARAVSSLGARATILTDSCNEAVMRAAAADLNNNVEVIAFPGGADWGPAEEEQLVTLAGRFDHVVAIERAGPSRTGHYYTMRARDMTSIVAPLERLIPLAREQGAGSTGIGDGGNEVGMGKVLPLVEQHIPNGKQIACVTATDHLIVCSVSNWGGYALAAALALTAADSRGDSVGDLLPQCLPTSEHERESLTRQVEAGVRDGVTGERSLSVDGFPLEMSLSVLDRLREAALSVTK